MSNIGKAHQRSFAAEHIIRSDSTLHYTRLITTQKCGKQAFPLRSVWNVFANWPSANGRGVECSVMRVASYRFERFIYQSSTYTTGHICSVVGKCVLMWSIFNHTLSDGFRRTDDTGQLKIKHRYNIFISHITIYICLYNENIMENKLYVIVQCIFI